MILREEDKRLVEKQNTDKELLVSVVIPAFNNEKYLSSCLDSVLGQSMQNIEVICVEDGSTDNTLDIIKKYCNIDERVRMINYGRNMGTAYARNRGLEAASGKYIYFLDSDDYILEKSMEELYAYAEKYQADCVYFDSKLQLETEGLGSPKLQFELKNHNEEVMTGAELFCLLKRNNVYTGSVCRQFWRMEYIKENNFNFPDGLLGEDALFSFQAMLAGKRMVIINKCYHVYRRHGGSMSTNVTARKAVSLFKIYCRLLKFWNGNTYDAEVNQEIEMHLETLYLQVERLYFRNKNEITETMFENLVERHLYKVLLEGKFKSDIVDKDILQKIKHYENVIVYGAGQIAVDTIRILEKEEIKVTNIIVTQKHENSFGINGIPVSEVKELAYLRETAVVILGVSEKYKKEISDNLRKYGFRNIVSII